jgi:succinate-acetate transporter protein
MNFLTFGRILLSVLFVLMYLYGLGYALYAMNLSSDLFPALGVLGIITGSFALYKILKNIWRKYETS